MFNNSVTDDKFLFTLLNSRKKNHVHDNVVNDCFNDWHAQTDFDFGFVTLGGFVIPSHSTQADGLTECPIQAHKCGKPNFLSCRVPC